MGLAHFLTGGVQSIVNRSIKFPGSPQPVPTAPPALGQHTDEILRDILELDRERIAMLRDTQVIA